MEGKQNGLMTYLEAAEFLNMKLATLYSKVSRKEIPHLRLSGRMVRFDPERLAEWLKERAIETGEDK